MQYINNPTCNKPFIHKEGVRWNVAFYFYNSINQRKLYKVPKSGLNSDDYLKTVNGIKIEINKKQRLAYANDIIDVYDQKLKEQQFIVDNREFAFLDKSENTFTYYINDFLNIAKWKEESTLRTYKSNANVFQKYLTEKKLEGLKLKEVTKEVVNDYLNQFKTVNHRNNNLRFLKAVLNHTVDQREVLAKNPIKSITEIDAGDSDSNKPYSEEQLTELLKTAKNVSNEFYLLLLMIYYTLHRPKTILQLRYRDFDFKKGLVYISGKITKNNKSATAILPKFLMDLIKENMADLEPQADSFFLGTSQETKGKQHDTKVFNKLQTPLTYYQDKFKTKAMQSVIKSGQTIYSLKHSGVIYLKSLKYTNDQIRATTGHQKDQSLGIYSREYQEDPIIRTDNILV